MLIILVDFVERSVSLFQHHSMFCTVPPESTRQRHADEDQYFHPNSRHQRNLKTKKTPDMRIPDDKNNDDDDDDDENDSVFSKIPSSMSQTPIVLPV